MEDVSRSFHSGWQAARETKIIGLIVLAALLISTLACSIILNSGQEFSLTQPKLSSIINSMSGICDGRGNDEAAAYQPDAEAHTLILLSTSGDRYIHGLNNELLEEYQPASINELELVACIGDEEEVVESVCTYGELHDPAPPVKRYSYHRQIDIYYAQTGELFLSGSVTGEAPGQCRQIESYERTAIYGGGVDSEDYLPWILEAIKGEASPE